MVYNAYNQYSPYWQQTGGQTNSQNAGHNVGQSGSSYQPLSAYQNNQQTPQSSFPQSSGNSAGGYGSQGYGNVNINGAGNARPQDTRASYNINDRASIDGATALGHLAYASSLGRDGSTTQQASNNNRQQSNADYNTANSYGVTSTPPIQYRNGEGRRGSNGSFREDNTRSQPATASPSFGYSSNNTGYQGPTGSNTQTQAQYLQPSRSSAEQHKTKYSEPSRPPSGQAIQQSHSRLGSQAAPSPPLGGNHSTPNQNAVSKNSAIVRGKDQTRVQTPQSNKQISTSQVPRGPTQIPQVPQATTNSQAESSTKKKPTAYASAKAAKEAVAMRVNEVRQSPTVNPSRDQSSKPATPVEPQYTTVDPSQVFNHEEYSRRQAAAAAEAAASKKAADEAEAARIAATLPKPPTTQTNGTEPDSAKKDQMELEMKQMIEKMRDYKAKDPSLFTQIWEQVKKSQPPQRAPSQSVPGSATSPMVVNSPSSSPSMIHSQLPPESDLPAGDEFLPNVDRGRFPAQRRRRGGKMTSTSRQSGTPKASTEPAAETSSPGNHGSPVPPEIAIPAPKVGKIFSNPSLQSMQQAMQQFHKNSKSPVAKAQQIPASNKQVTTTPPSQPVSAETAPPPKPGGTYWPESKKQALAEAARVALTSTRPNNAKTITTQEIHELLDQNPSYTQMCEILEYRGFVIDRGQFARILLRAVPDLGSTANSPNAAPAKTASTTPIVTASNDNTTPTTKANAATPTEGSFGKLTKSTPNGSAQKNVPQPLPYAVPPTAAHQIPDGYATPYPPAPASAKQVNEVNQSDRLPQDYRFVNPAPWPVNEPGRHAGGTNQDRQDEPGLHSHPSFPPHQPLGSVNSQVLDQSGTVQPNDLIPPHHPTKQEMARKRTFGEIVDLTQTLSDDEELERQRPRPRIGYEDASDPSDSVKHVFDQSAQRQQDGRTTPKPFKYKYSGRDALLQSYDIVEPMNKRRDALRRSTYNPKSIARDVLLGIGKHPTMTPLNAHLDVLKDRFKAVDLESDLSTFRWDLVDPEGEDNAKRYDTDEEDAVPAAAAIARQRPAPTAVMTNGDSGNVVKDDHAPHRTTKLREKPYKRGPYKKTLIRSGIQPIGSTDIPQRPSSQSSPHARTTGNVPSTSAPDLSRFALNSSYMPQTDVKTSKASSSSTPGDGPKRKGRPPGARNKQARPDKGIPKNVKTPTLNETPSIEEAKPSDEGRGKRTPSVEEESPVRKPSSPIPSRPRISTTTPSRPSGLRNSISAITPMDGIAVVVESRSPSVIMTPQASAKKGSQKKTEDLSNRALSPAPSYTIYGCHWENCPAELHSLETLKKHVRKHRRDVDGVYPCLWADCSDSSNPVSNQPQSEIGQHRRLKFKTDTEWVKHVESNHLRTDWEASKGAAVNVEQRRPLERK